MTAMERLSGNRRRGTGAGPRAGAPARRPWLRPAARRGQTVLLALAVFFLLTLLGSIFVTMVVRNVHRVSRQGTTDDALTLALAGIEYAAQQFRASEEGADWRPVPSEVLWRTPNPPALPPVPLNPPHPIFGASLDAAERRLLDPDYVWLSDDGRFERPYVRIAMGRGRVLLRVTYQPEFRPASAASTGPDEFDPNSGWIHIESIGRPGEFTADDPTFLMDPSLYTGSGRIVGVYRKAEAWVPVGLLDQLWWITNVTGERGPAVLGTPPYRDGNGRYSEYETFFLGGGIRSNVDIRWEGRNRVRIYPARGEGVFVKGESRRAPLGAGQASVLIEVADDDGSPPVVGAAPPVIPPDNQDDNPANDNVFQTVNQGDSGTPQFDPIVLQNSGGTARYGFLDERFVREASTAATEAQSIRFIGPPALDQVDVATNIDRWRELTRDSGGIVQIQDGGRTRLINTGWYGLTDFTLPPDVRARGLYLDNFGDVQFPFDRSALKEVWLNPTASDALAHGWRGDRYTPRAVNSRESHDVMVIWFTRVAVPDPGNPARTILKPVLRVTRWDMDERQMNIQPATGRQRMCYDLTLTGPSTGLLVNPRQTRDYDLPENGVVLVEGSVRVHGVLGVPYDTGSPESERLTRPRTLTLVSSGTIYIEGNILMESAGWHLGLLAQDFVALNPTAFTRIHGSPPMEADGWDPATGLPNSYHYKLDPNNAPELDFSFSSAEQLSAAMVHVKHTGVWDDANSETPVVLYQPFLGTSANPWPDWARDRFDFGAFAPPGVPTAQQFYYLFHEIPAGTSPTWPESNFQTVNGSPGNFERKSFFLSPVARNATGGVPIPPGFEALFRLQVGYRDPRPGEGGSSPYMPPNVQPYWLARLAVLPFDPAAANLDDAGRPLRIRVEAVIYAYKGSWFIIPPPYFNENPDDSWANYLTRGNVRARGTVPDRGPGSRLYPFYNEPLNIDIEIRGAITENMPAEPSDRASWTSRLWVNPQFFFQGGTDLRPNFRPNIRYVYDANLRRMVRVRKLSTGEELIAWTAPGGAPPPGVQTLGAILAAARGAENTYIVTLPLLPRLPAAPVIYEGNPL